MKKLMFAMAAVAAGAVFADEGIVSANVVGYQEKSLDANFNFVLSSFSPVSGTMKFKDIATKDIAYLTEMIQLLADDGSCQTTAEYPELGEEVYLQFTYATTDDGASEAGWYLMADENFAYPQGEREIPFGQGFLIEGLGAGEALTFSGQVANDDTEIELAANFNFTGNCSPATIKFKDIATKDIAYLTEMIQLLADDGSCQTTAEYPELGEEVYLQFTYATTEDGASEAGWYLMADENFAYPQGEREIPAAAAFLIEGLGAGESITIPSAL